MPAGEIIHGWIKADELSRVKMSLPLKWLQLWQCSWLECVLAQLWNKKPSPEIFPIQHPCASCPADTREQLLGKKNTKVHMKRVTWNNRRWIVAVCLGSAHHHSKDDTVLLPSSFLWGNTDFAECLTFSTFKDLASCVRLCNAVLFVELLWNKSAKRFKVLLVFQLTAPFYVFLIDLTQHPFIVTS